jgi:hypothetical protein
MSADPGEANIEYSKARCLLVPPTDTTDRIIFMTSAATVRSSRTKFARLGVGLTETPTIADEFLCV